MPALTGIVEAISIKPMNEPDRFGNEFRGSIKVGEDWVSWGGLKKQSISYKEGDSYHELLKGMEIEFMYKQNGDFKNISKTTLSVLNTEGAQAKAPSAPPPQRATTQAPQAKGGFVNPAEVGQCLNLAVDVLHFDESDLLNKTKVTKAIKWYKEVRELFTELYPTVTTAPPVKKESPEHKAQVERLSKTLKQDARPTPPPQDFSDDDPI